MFAVQGADRMRELNKCTGACHSGSRDHSHRILVVCVAWDNSREYGNSCHTGCQTSCIDRKVSSVFSVPEQSCMELTATMQAGSARNPRLG